MLCGVRLGDAEPRTHILKKQVFDAFWICRPLKESVSKYVYLFDGKRLCGSETPLTLDMETEVENLVEASSC